MGIEELLDELNLDAPADIDDGMHSEELDADQTSVGI